MSLAQPIVDIESQLSEQPMMAYSNTSSAKFMQLYAFLL
jgi:hypothetical protein